MITVFAFMVQVDSPTYNNDAYQYECDRKIMMFMEFSFEIKHCQDRRINYISSR